MDRRIIEKDGKWRNDHGIDTKWTIFDGKGFFVETRYDTSKRKKKGSNACEILSSNLAASFFSIPCNIFFNIQIPVVKRD